MKTINLVRISAIAGLIFICLTFINIRISESILSLGFCIVFSTAIIFGGKIAGLGCGIGAMLFDISAGFMHYAPFTLLAYGLSAFIVGIMLKDDFAIMKIVIAGLLATFIKVCVYFIANYIYYGAPYAIGSIPLELINCGLGIVLGIPLGKFLKNVIPTQHLS